MTMTLVCYTVSMVTARTKPEVIVAISSKPSARPDVIRSTCSIVRHARSELVATAAQNQVVHHSLGPIGWRDIHWAASLLSIDRTLSMNWISLCACHTCPLLYWCVSGKQKKCHRWSGYISSFHQARQYR